MKKMIYAIIMIACGTNTFLVPSEASATTATSLKTGLKELVYICPNSAHTGKYYKQGRCPKCSKFLVRVNR